MNRRIVTVPELGLIALTRALFGAGIGLLVADRLSDVQRRAVGWTLVGVGVLTTAPLAAIVLRSKERARDRATSSAPLGSETAELISSPASTVAGR
jgi:4-amino-4-deoxy-L-arabinose transferase-like glycosyltransferase